jgi:hypothetical protein
MTEHNPIYTLATKEGTQSMSALSPDPGSVVIHGTDLKVLDYAAHVGVNHRTVREWLQKGLLPDAYKDGRGQWWIPADSRKLETFVAPRVEPSPTAGTTIVSMPHLRDTPQLHPAPGFIPLYMPLDEAAPLLGVTPYQIARHPDIFDVVPWGENGALVVPVRRLLGLTS